MSEESIDYVRLRKEIASAARQAFTFVRQQNSDETFYAFGLYTDSDVMTIGPFSNSEEGLERLGQKYEQLLGQEYEEMRQKYNESGVPLWLRWAPDDWEYCDVGVKYFDEVQKMIGGGRYFETDEEFVARKKGVLGAFVAALRELDAEGFFGKGNEREAVTLLLNITDPSDFEVKWMLEYVQALNPEPAYRGYMDSHTRYVS